MHETRHLGGVNRQTTAFWKALIMYLPLVHPNIVECEHYWGTPDGGRRPGGGPQLTRRVAVGLAQSFCAREKAFTDWQK